MGNNGKTKSQLQSDIEILRKRILELEEAQRSNEFLERALLDSEQRYRDLYENAPLGYQSLDDDGNIVEVNDAWCNALGYKRVDIIGMNFSGFLTMESNKKFKEKFPGFKKTGKAHSVEFEMVKKDGSRIIMSIEGRATYDIHGNFKRSHCILNDITERKHAEEKLIESERRLKKAQEMSMVGDYEWILDTNKINWSDGLYKIFGFVIGTPLTYEKLLKCIHPDDRENNTKVMKKWLKYGGGEPYEYRIIHADGSIKYLYEDCEVIYNSDGKPEKLFGIIHDITERKRAEKEILKSEETLRKVMKASGDYILMLDKEHKIQFINRTELGIEAKDILGKPLYTLVDKKDQQRVKKHLDEVIKKTKRREYETVYHRPDGTDIYYYSVAVPLLSDGKVIGTVVNSRDITERKNAEEEIIEWKNRYESAVASSGHILYDWDSVTNEVTYGGKYENILGYSSHEMTGGLSRWVELIHPDDKQYFKKKIVHLVSTKEPAKLEYRVQRKDGKYIYVEDEGQFIKESENKITQMIGFVKDITERKKAKEALQVSEERYRSLIETSPDGIAVTDMNGNFTLVNKKTVEMLGYSSEKDLIGMNSISRVAPEERNALQKRVEVNLKTQIPQSFEQTFIRKDGTRFTAESNSQVLLNENGEVNGFLSIVRDITERKKTEEKLRNNEDFLDKVIEKTPNPMWISDEKGTVIRINTSLKNLLKVTDKEIIGKYNVLKDEQVKKQGFLPLVKSVYKGGKTVNFIIDYYTGKEKQVLVKRKTHKVLDITFSSIKNSEGKVTNVICQHKDITDRKAAEDAVRSAEENYRSIFENAVEGIYQTTPDGKFISANPALAIMLGYNTSDELIEKIKNVEKHLYVDSKARDEFKKLINKQSIVRNYEIQLYCKDRKTIWVSLSSRAVLDSKGKIKLYEGTFEDITERKKVEDEIRNSREQLRNLSSHLQSIREEERGVIAREIHDDLGQSLTALKMDVSWLNKHLHKNKEKTQTKINGMSFLISETIRSVQRISSELRPGLLDDLGLSSAIQWYTNEFVSRTGIKCEVTLDPKEIKLEENLSIAIYRIFQESLTNVIRHANATKVNVNFTLNKNNLNLVVKDNGIGIDEDKLEDPKSLGLIGMQERLYPWNGTVTISGREGKGTTVTVNVKC